MHTRQTNIINQEERLLKKQIHPWDAGRSTDRHTQATFQRPIQESKTTISDRTTPVSIHPKPIIIADHRSSTSSYQWIILIVVSSICILAALNVLAYFILDKPLSITEVSSSSALSSSVTTSASSSVYRKTPAVHRSTTVVPTFSSAATIQKTISSSVVSQSTASANAIQQLPTNRTEQRKLLRAVQDAKRARQNSPSTNQ